MRYGDGGWGYVLSGGLFGVIVICCLRCGLLVILWCWFIVAVLVGLAPVVCCCLMFAWWVWFACFDLWFVVLVVYCGFGFMCCLVFWCLVIGGFWVIVGTCLLFIAGSWL